MCRGWRDTTPLYCACESGQLHIVKYLVEELGADCYSQYDGGFTLLHIAASFGTLDVVKYLIEEQNCATEPKNKEGNTPLLRRL